MKEMTTIQNWQVEFNIIEQYHSAAFSALEASLKVDEIAHRKREKEWDTSAIFHVLETRSLLMAFAQALAERDAVLGIERTASGQLKVRQSSEENKYQNQS